MKQKLYILFGILLFSGLLIFLWWNQAVKPPNPTDKRAIIFTIDRGETIRSVAERLQKENLIRSSVAFFLLARFTNLASNMQAGEFRLNPSMNLAEVGNSLKHGTIDMIITIPEGWRNEEIALKIAQELGIPENEFLKLAKEGYMFPDTYHFPKDATAEAVVKVFSDNFNKKVTSEVIQQSKKKGLSLEELITIASLIEREARLTEDRPLIASVILNRLKIGMKLDIDATVQYALGYQPKERSWWKKDLTSEDLEIDSPYNTYKNQGLPPTPICNPGLSVIKAVIEAPEIEYLYYVADKSGKSHFTKTIEEHNININKYLN